MWFPIEKKTSYKTANNGYFSTFRTSILFISSLCIIICILVKITWILFYISIFWLSWNQGGQKCFFFFLNPGGLCFFVFFFFLNVEKTLKWCFFSVFFVFFSSFFQFILVFFRGFHVISIQCYIQAGKLVKVHRYLRQL